MACWAPFHSKKIWLKKREILRDSTLTRACKPMTRSTSTILVTRLWLDQVMTLTRLWLDQVMTLTRLWLEGLVTLTRKKLLGHIADRGTETACEMHDLEYHSAHAQMVWGQRFRKTEIWLDTWRQARKLHTVEASNNRDHPTRSPYPTTFSCFLSFPYADTILSAHLLCGTSRIERSANGKVATILGEIETFVTRKYTLLGFGTVI